MAKEISVGDAVLYVAQDGLSHSAVVTHVLDEGHVDLNVVPHGEERMIGYHDRRVLHLHNVPCQASTAHVGIWLRA